MRPELRLLAQVGRSSDACSWTRRKAVTADSGARSEVGDRVVVGPDGPWRQVWHWEIGQQREEHEQRALLSCGNPHRRGTRAFSSCSTRGIGDGAVTASQHGVQMALGCWSVVFREGVSYPMRKLRQGRDYHRRGEIGSRNHGLICNSVTPARAVYTGLSSNETRDSEAHSRHPKPRCLFRPEFRCIRPQLHGRRTSYCARDAAPELGPAPGAGDLGMAARSQPSSRTRTPSQVPPWHAPKAENFEAETATLLLVYESTRHGTPLTAP